MSLMHPHPTNLSPHIFQQLSQQRTRMAWITQYAIQALDEESRIYSYTIYNALSTLAEIHLLKQAFLGNQNVPEAEAWLQNLTQTYLQEMEKIPHDTCRQIVQMLQTVKPQPEDGDLLQGLRQVFSGWLGG